MPLMRKRQFCSLLCLLLGTAGLAERLAAETYRYELASAGIRIWDLTNNSTLTQDAKGKLTGTYSDSFWDLDANGNRFDAVVTGTLKGSVTQSRGVARVKLTSKGNGTATYATGDPTTYAWSGTFAGEVDPERLLIVGTVKGTEKIGKKPRRVPPEDEELKLPEGMDGSSTLTFTTTTAGKKVTVTDGQLTLSNGDIYTCTGKGSFSAKKNQDNLTLSFYDPADSTHKKLFTITLTLDVTTGTIVKFSGKVLGQTLKGTNITASAG